jgi:hypothetical protein
VQAATEAATERRLVSAMGLTPKGKYVIFDKKEAHVYKKENYIMTHATDMALLDAWVEEQLRI